jgi:membrane protein DedA with SNARE-associated domain
VLGAFCRRSALRRLIPSRLPLFPSLPEPVHDYFPVIPGSRVFIQAFIRIVYFDPLGSHAVACDRYHFALANPMLGTIAHLVTTFGYAIVAAFILFECAGFPIPGETALLVASGFAGAGKLSIAAVIMIAAGAAILGGTGGYWLGRLLGQGFVERWGRYIGLNPKKIQRLTDFFVRHGSSTVFFGRFIGIVRTYLSLFAGVSKMPYLTFTVFNALGAIVWASIFGTIGYVFGQNLDEVEHLIRIFGWGALLGLAMIAASWYLRRWISTTVPTPDHGATATGLRLTMRRLLYGSALISVRNGSPRLSRLSVTVIFAVGLVITTCLVLFVSITTRGLAEYDPLVRFEEVVSTAIDSWLTQRQSLIVLAIAKFGSALSVCAGIAAAIVSLLSKQRLYMFTMLFALAGGETLNALFAYLNRGSQVFLSSHFSVRLSYLLAYDNIIVPIVVFGMLAYIAVASTKQMLSAVTIIIGFGLPLLAIVASSFLCGLHGGIAFFEELLCAIVWLWFCIGLTGFIQLRRRQHAALRNISEDPL